MRALILSLFCITKILASNVLFNACAELSRFSVYTCEMFRLVGLLAVVIMLVQELTTTTIDYVPLGLTLLIAVAVALARPSNHILYR